MFIGNSYGGEGAKHMSNSKIATKATTLMTVSELIHLLPSADRGILVHACHCTNKVVCLGDMMDWKFFDSCLIFLLHTNEHFTFSLLPS
ncbi:hypothetical protein GBA52_028893 [Prunus armeniaca]|nr:hypothetical protein GBA52_028893 [Prunus armeniaca]